MLEEKKSKIKQSVLRTKNRRTKMLCKVIECKIDNSRINSTTRKSLYKLFTEAKWLYNFMIDFMSIHKISEFNSKIKTVPVKVLDKTEERIFEQISAQMKQGMQTRIFNSLSALSALKVKGHKVGKLKFKKFIKSIPLKQHTQTFTLFKRSKTIKIQGIKQALKVYGLNQIPEVCEIANANLTKIGKDFYLQITIYVEKEIINVPDISIGIDFGCETQLTLSNGEKIKFQVPVDTRVKKFDRDLARKIKGSKNKQKEFLKREKAYHTLVNQKKEVKNKIVNSLVKKYKVICFQDESIAEWKQNGHGKKIQNSALGGIIMALQRKAVTPIVIDKYFPSSQLCSKCGNRHKLELKDRIYVCEKCGLEIDRDVNAAKNIENEGIRISLVPVECREVKLVEQPTDTFALSESKLVALKQETAIPLG